jgi:hypothetical protein
MLKLVPNPTFKLDVNIPLPTGNVAKIKLEYKHLGRAALEDWLKSTADEEGNVLRKDHEALGEVIVDWSGVDEKFSQENLEQLLDSYPSAGRAMINAYLPAILEGKTKN